MNSFFSNYTETSINALECFAFHIGRSTNISG
jgi:hypothetical protein